MKYKLETGSCGHKFIRPDGYMNKKCSECLPQVQHTPTPWVGLDDSYAKIGEPNDDVGCTVIADFETDIRDMSHQTMKANRNFALLAVNAHEELKEAIRNLLYLARDYHEDLLRQNGQWTAERIAVMIADAEQAIAKAEGNV